MCVTFFFLVFYEREDFQCKIDGLVVSVYLHIDIDF